MFNWDDFKEGNIGVSFKERFEVISFLQMAEKIGVKLVAPYESYVNSIFTLNSRYIFCDSCDGECYTCHTNSRFEYTVSYNEAFNTNYPSKTELMEFLEV